MNIKLLNERHLEFLTLKGGFTGSSESTLAKMPHCCGSYIKYAYEPLLQGSDSGVAGKYFHKNPVLDCVLGIGNDPAVHYQSD